MSSILTIFLLIVGLAFVVFGADWLVDGASVIARKAGLSEFVIGLTIVGFGTSCPELVVSLTGAIGGNADISIGNVLGSNIFNTLLILGLTAVLSPIAMTAANRKVDIPMVFGISALMVFFLLVCGGISRIAGVLFIVLFIGYMFYCFRSGNVCDEDAPSSTKPLSLFSAIVLCLLGLGCLIGGGQLFVDNAVKLAHQLGVSDKFIAVTLLAGGTSLPELVTCIVAAAKGKDQLALGNILGSNAFNILLIIGLSAIVNPLRASNISYVDMGVLMLSTILLAIWAYTGKKDRIDRWEGAVMLLCEALYLTYLFIAG